MKPRDNFAFSTAFLKALLTSSFLRLQTTGFSMGMTVRQNVDAVLSASMEWLELGWEYVKMLLLLSHFSRVRPCATPETAAHQAPPSLGFSRQEHWSGLPFPSPVHESEKWKWSCSVVSNSLQPHGLYVAHQAPPSMGFSRQEHWSGLPCPPPGDLLAGGFFTTNATWEAHFSQYYIVNMRFH